MRHLIRIFADIKIGIDKAQKEKAEPVSYLVIPNRKEAIRYAIEHAQEGDMITILGLGHESYQEENGVKTPHSDIQFAAQCCKECYPQGWKKTVISRMATKHLREEEKWIDKR